MRVQESDAMRRARVEEEFRDLPNSVPGRWLRR